MKRTYLWLLAAVLLLSGCGGQTGDVYEQISIPEQNGLLLEQATVTEGAQFLLTTEWEVYDPSAEEIWFFIENRSGGDAAFGQPYTLEKWLDECGWYQVPFREDTGWDDILYTLAPGGKQAACCHLSLFDYSFSSGDCLRIVKEIEGQTCAAEFRLEEGAAVSAQTPYGFGPLEDLPERYTASDAAGSGAVIFTDAGVENTEAVGAFLEKVSLGVPCQLRTVQDHGESTPMVIDVIWENDCFLWRMRSGGTEVSERRLSYIVTDGTDLYLSDGADWDAGERYGDQRVFLVPPLQGAEWVPDVEAMTADRLAWNTARYKLWSADGVWCARLTDEPTAFSVSWQKPGEGSGGRTYDLADWDGLETAITGLAWREDGKLTLKCETADGGTSRLTFDPEAGTLT